MEEALKQVISAIEAGNKILFAGNGFILKPLKVYEPSSFTNRDGQVIDCHVVEFEGGHALTLKTVSEQMIILASREERYAGLISLLMNNLLRELTTMAKSMQLEPKRALLVLSACIAESARALKGPGETIPGDKPGTPAV